MIYDMIFDYLIYIYIYICCITHMYMALFVVYYMSWVPFCWVAEQWLLVILLRIERLGCHGRTPDQGGEEMYSSSFETFIFSPGTESRSDHRSWPFKGQQRSKRAWSTYVESTSDWAGPKNHWRVILNSQKTPRRSCDTCEVSDIYFVFHKSMLEFLFWIQFLYGVHSFVFGPSLGTKPCCKPCWIESKTVWSLSSRWRSRLLMTLEVPWILRIRAIWDKNMKSNDMLYIYSFFSWVKMWMYNIYVLFYITCIWFMSTFLSNYIYIYITCGRKHRDPCPQKQFSGVWSATGSDSGQHWVTSSAGSSRDFGPLGAKECCLHVICVQCLGRQVGSELSNLIKKDIEDMVNCHVSPANIFKWSGRSTSVSSQQLQELSDAGSSQKFLGSTRSLIGFCVKKCNVHWYSPSSYLDIASSEMKHQWWISVFF